MPAADDRAESDRPRGGVRGVFIGLAVSAVLLALGLAGLSGYNDDGDSPWWVAFGWFGLLAGGIGALASLVTFVIWAIDEGIRRIRDRKRARDEPPTPSP